MTLIVVATDLAGGQGVAAVNVQIAPALDSSQALNASVIEAAAASQLENAAAAAASSNLAAAILLVGSTTSLLGELPAQNGTNSSVSTSDAVRTQALDILTFLAANAEPTSANMQLLASAASAALSDPSQVSPNQLDTALSVVTIMLENRLSAGNDFGALEDGPSVSILGTMRAASDAGQFLMTPTGIRGGSTVAKQSNLLGRAMLAGSIPGEDQRELQVSGSSGGFQLAMAVGRLNILDALGDSQSTQVQEGGGSVLGLIAAGDSDPAEMAAIARRYCSGSASDFDATEVDDSLGM